MKGLKETNRCDRFKPMALIGVTFGHIFMNINLHSLPKKILLDIVVCFEKSNVACNHIIVILFEDLDFDFGRVG
jgi:hypothetical protein